MCEHTERKWAASEKERVREAELARAKNPLLTHVRFDIGIARRGYMNMYVIDIGQLLEEAQGRYVLIPATQRSKEDMVTTGKCSRREY